MGTVKVTLLGRFEVLRDDRPLPGFESQKVQELFAYLLLNRERAHPREAVASILWEHGSTAQSRSYLRRLLWQLQHALEDGKGTSDQPLLLVRPDWIQFNPNADLWFDVAIFEDAYRKMRGVPGQRLEAEGADLLQRSTRLYTSDLLESWYHGWCLLERERLKSMYLTMLDKLMEYCAATRRYEQGLEYARRILQIDCAREHTHCQLMQMLYVSGNRTDALRQYELCETALKEELDVRPSRRTVALYEQIRTDQLEAVCSLGMRPEPAAEPPVANTNGQNGLDRERYSVLAGFLAPAAPRSG